MIKVKRYNSLHIGDSQGKINCKLDYVSTLKNSKYITNE